MNNTHNPPAFPVSVPGHVYGDGSSETPYVAQEGMTLRDYFAAAALSAFLSNDQYGPSGTELGVLGDAERAYRYADAMIVARTSQKSQKDEVAELRQALFALTEHIRGSGLLSDDCPCKTTALQILWDQARNALSYTVHPQTAPEQ